MAEELIFHQLLAGEDFATADQFAATMRNHVYVIGDGLSRQALLVDPAYDVAAILRWLAAADLSLVGVLATHYHADHVGGDIFGEHIQGLVDLLELADVQVHVQKDEIAWVTEMTRCAGVIAGRAQRRGRRTGRLRLGAAPAHSGPHPGQSMHPGRRQPRVRGHPVHRRMWPHRPTGGRPGRDVLEPATLGQPAGQARPVARSPLFACVFVPTRDREESQLGLGQDEQTGMAQALHLGLPVIGNKPPLLAYLGAA